LGKLLCVVLDVFDVLVKKNVRSVLQTIIKEVCNLTKRLELADFCVVMAYPFTVILIVSFGKREIVSSIWRRSLNYSYFTVWMMME